MALQPSRNVQRNTRRGFSLLEALLALVIFTLISFAISLALSTVFQAQAAARRREEEAEVVRAVFGFLTRDLSAAFASANNPAAVFIAGGATTPGTTQRASGSLLLLSTLAHRIDFTDGQVAATGPGVVAMPQADFMLVRYDYDPATGSVFRTTATVPNLEVIERLSPSPESLLAERVTGLFLRFWDAEQRGWRTDWNYQQRNRQQQTTDSNNPAELQASAAAGDTGLPAAVEITLTLARRDGTTGMYTTTVPVAAPQPFAPATAPAGTSPATTGIPARSGS
ncbi:MAG: prepilin-type N-terminal cleavage/methylation domain-containing protein [Chloroherpetonaceae bacterium]|nr:prepilin-type N-terminal cleavage/methylation domain-containing protein [Chthonomonadaceae bacterium]MDW8208930.1 prepilin-type N-terminal cleavage/methylation domain-containing protein [Chloroherpetonaceae bacterium]